ncbi:MAG: hypothetical protein JWN21_531, partial [Sphingomonas bacterium]|uniref:hypothetical protein n=1 Tax=Sphingomonas bacterium TaxID=1895847 RepID=UPI00260CB58A
ADVEISRTKTELSFRVDEFKQKALLQALPTTFAKHDAADWVYVKAGVLNGPDDPVPVLQEAARHAVAAARKLVPASR